MIDEKKIEEAQEIFFEEEVYGKGEPITYNDLEGEFVCREERYDGGHVKNAFEAGAKWAQQEFLNSLWHDASEEPSLNTRCLGFYKSFADSATFRYPIMHEDWKDYVRYSTLHKWCYLDDLLPKEGGKNSTMSI